jgi:hypothetical protein
MYACLCIYWYLFLLLWKMLIWYACLSATKHPTGFHANQVVTFIVKISRIMISYSVELSIDRLTHQPKGRTPFRADSEHLGQILLLFTIRKFYLRLRPVQSVKHPKYLATLSFNVHNSALNSYCCKVSPLAYQKTGRGNLIVWCNYLNIWCGLISRFSSAQRISIQERYLPTYSSHSHNI